MLSAYTKITSHLATRKKDDSGATAVEYALVIGLVVVVIVGILALFGPKIQDFVSGFTFRCETESCVNNIPDPVE